jgi:taurine dioxygenase/sulfonate dioxygenase
MEDVSYLHQLDLLVICLKKEPADICAVTRSIVGLKKEESDALLGFLLNHVSRGIDYQARIKWVPKTVIVWDVSLHTLSSP